MKEKIRGFIFDLDGVLTNTSEYHYLAWKKIAEELGIPFDKEKNESLKGVSRRESLIILLGRKELDNSTFNALLVRKNSYYTEYIRDITPDNLLPGTLKILNAVKELGGRAAVASVSKNTDQVLRRLGIKDKFDVVLDGYSVKRTKPDPEQFLLASKLLSVIPENCVVFEDAVAGIEAAKRAHMFSIGIGNREILSNADLVYDSLDKIEFNSMLEKLKKSAS